jgi:hypothetical protein
MEMQGILKSDLKSVPLTEESQQDIDIGNGEYDILPPSSN